MKEKKDFSKMSLKDLGDLILNLQEQLWHTQEQLSHTQAKLTEARRKFDKSQLLIQNLKDDNDKLKAELARAKKSRPSQR